MTQQKKKSYLYILISKAHLHNTYFNVELKLIYLIMRSKHPSY